MSINLINEGSYTRNSVEENKDQIIQELLSNFLNVFGLDYSVTCKKIVNLVDVKD